MKLVRIENVSNIASRDQGVKAAVCRKYPRQVGESHQSRDHSTNHDDYGDNSVFMVQGFVYFHS